MDEAKRRLGYRLRLVDAEIPDSLSRGSSLKITLHVINDGFAAPYNPRPVELVLRGTKGGPEIHIPVKADPRLWLPGEEQTLNIEWSAPQNLAPDKYYAFIRFPDPYPSISRRPEYSIRLANTGLWEAKTGYNWLKATVTASISEHH